MNEIFWIIHFQAEEVTFLVKETHSKVLPNQCLNHTELLTMMMDQGKEHNGEK